MPDPLYKLICDTLLYFKDPLLPKQTIFATAEESIFFKRSTAPIPKELVEEAKQSLPRITPAEPIVRSLKISEPTKVLKSTSQPVQQVPVAADSAILQTKKALDARPKSSDISPIKKTLLRIAPHIKLTDEVPDDAVAKRVATAWKEKIADVEVILLACNADAETLEFLKTLGKAVDQNLGKAKILPAERLEKENRWDLFLQKNEFRLIIASDGVQKLPELMRFYKAIPATSQYYLDKTPLVALSPASIYKSIENKAALWKTLCQHLRSQK